jgi:glucose/arabinose dehydrogenase
VRRPRLVIAVVLVLASLPGTAAAAQYPPGYSERTLADGLSQPTAVAWTPDGRMLVAEKGGTLRVFRPGSPSRTAADLRTQVNSFSHRGLVGLAVDSDFESNRFVYLLYTYELKPLTPDGRDPMVSRLGRFVLGDDDQLGAETVLLGTDSSAPCGAPANDHDCLPADDSSHGVGTVRSAPDGTLFVGNGDGASWARVDPLALNTYDERTPRGKILHIDRSGNGLPGHPFCPSNADLTHVCTKLWAKGLRNPFRFTLRADGGLIVGDVGWNSWEEIDLIGPGEGGRSWGWPCYEGFGRTPGYRDLPECDDAAIGPQQAPDLEYPHAGTQSVLAGPEIGGRIFFADWSAGWIRHADSQLGDVVEFASDWEGVDLELSPAGNVAYVSLDGSVREILPPGQPQPPPNPGPQAPAAPATGDTPPPAPPPTAPPAPSGTTAPPRTVSPSRVRCVVPDVRGRTLAAARKALARRRCRAGRVIRRHKRRTRPGVVLSQYPRKPARLPRNGRVLLIVSR